jgi:hypothetical protein
MKVVVWGLNIAKSNIVDTGKGKGLLGTAPELKYGH